MRNIRPLTSVIKQRNLQVSRLEEQSLRLRKKLVKTRGEAFERIQGELGKSSSPSGGGIGPGLLGLGGAALGGRLLRGLRNRFRKPSRLPRTKPANNIIPTKGLRGGGKPRIPSVRGGLRMGRFNAIATTALTGVDYGLRLAEGQTQTQAVSGALSTTAGGLAGFAAGAKGGALLGGSIGALFGGVGAAPGAAIGGLLGGLLGGFGGAELGATISDRVTGADQRRKVEEKKSRLSARTSKFGRTVEEFDNALDLFGLLTRKKIYFIDDEYNIDLRRGGDDDPVDPRGKKPPRGPRPGGPKPVKLEKPDNIFEAEIPGVAEEHKDGQQFRFAPDYVPTGLDYSEIPSTPSNKVVGVDKLPILLRPFTEKFDLEEAKGEEQTIQTPYGPLIRKPATLFAPAGFVFLNRDAQEDKRFRTEQTVKSAPVQAVGGATGFLSFLSVFRGRRGRRSTTRTRTNTEILGKDAKPTQPPTIAPPRSVKQRTRVRNPIKKRQQTAQEIRDKLVESNKGEVTVSNLRMSQEQLEKLFQSPTTSGSGGTNFNAMLLPLLAGATALGIQQQGQGSKQMPFMMSPPASQSVITSETSMPYSKYLEYESYMKVWK